jgi:hypothetical protein
MGDLATLFTTERVALVGVRRGGLGRLGPLAEPPREFRRGDVRRQPGRVAGARPQCVGDVADGAPIDVVVVAVPPAVAVEEVPQAVLGRARERRLPVFLVRTDTRTTVDRVEAVISTGRTSSAASVRQMADRLEKSADLHALPGE